MLEEFKGPFTIDPHDTAITDGHRKLDGQVMRAVQVNIAEHRKLVTLSVSDAVTVEAAMDPFLALAVAEALINAALAIYFRPGGPLHPANSRGRP